MTLMTSAIVGLGLAIANTTLRSGVLKKAGGRLGWRNFLSALPVFIAPFMAGFSFAGIVATALFAMPLIINSVSSIRKINKVRKEKRGEKVNAYEEASKAVKAKEKSIERAEKRGEILNNLKGLKIFSVAALSGVLGWAISKNSARLADMKNSIQDLYLQKGARELALKNIKLVGEKFISVSEVTLPDGSKRYEVGRDLKPAQVAEIKEYLSSKLGVDVNDPKYFAVCGLNNNDLGFKYGADRVAMYYDRKEASLKSVGAPVDEMVLTYGKGKNASEMFLVDFVNKANESMKSKGLHNYKEVAENGFLGGIHMCVLGNSAVALSMNGVVLAHAVAGNDGRIRLQGNAGMQGSGAQKRLVSKISGLLKSAGTMQEWCDIAKGIILQPENIKALNNGLLDKKNEITSFKARKNILNSIINAPKKNLKTLGRAL